MTQTRSRIVSAYKNGRTYNAFAAHGERGLFEFDSLADAGMIRIECHGSENVYFEWQSDAGTIEAGYCKCL